MPEQLEVYCWTHLLTPSRKCVSSRCMEIEVSLSPRQERKRCIMGCREERASFFEDYVERYCAEAVRLQEV